MQFQDRMRYTIHFRILDDPTSVTSRQVSDLLLLWKGRWQMGQQPDYPDWSVVSHHLRQPEKGLQRDSFSIAQVTHLARCPAFSCRYVNEFIGFCWPNQHCNITGEPQRALNIYWVSTGYLMMLWCYPLFTDGALCHGNHEPCEDIPTPQNK